MRANFTYNSPNNPASSRALNRLHSNRLIPQSTVQPYIHARPVININNQPVRGHSPMPINGGILHRSGSVSASHSRLEMQGESRLNKSITFVQAQGVQVGLKPLSETMMVHNQAGTRVRSNSLTPEPNTHIRSLQARLGEYSLQVLQLTIKLNEKDKEIQNYENQIVGIRAQYEELETKIAAIVQNEEQKTDRMRELERINYELGDRVKEMQLGGLAHEEDSAIRLNQLTEDLINKNREMEELTNKYQQLCLEMGDYEHKCSTEMGELRRKLEEHESRNNQLGTRVAGYERQNVRLKQQLKFRDIEVRACVNKLDDSAQQIHQLRQIAGDLQTELKCCLRELEITKQSERGCRDKSNEFSQQLERVMSEFRAAKSIGQQQIEALTQEIERMWAHNQSLLEQIALTKKVTLMRENLFEREVIYDLKQKNDKLWERLLQKQQQDLQQHKQMPMAKQSECCRCKQLEEQIKGFNNEMVAPEVEFYIKKCKNLERVVEENLQINMKLKQSLLQHKSAGHDGQHVPVSKYNFVCQSLQSCRKTNQALVKSIDRIKAEYETKQSKQQHHNQANVSLQKTQQLAKKSMQQSAQVARLQQQCAKWKQMYQQTKAKNNSVSPITLLKAQHEDLVLQHKAKQENSRRVNKLELKLKLSFLSSQVDKIKSVTTQIRTQFPRKELLNYSEQLIAQAATIVQQCLELAGCEGA